VQCHASPSLLASSLIPCCCCCLCVSRRKSGYGGYGPAGLQKGARVIVLVEGQDPSTSPTWIRQEDGSRVDQGPSPGEQKERLQQDTCAGKAAAAASQVLDALPRAGELRSSTVGRLLSTLFGWASRV
jgi:hypothetical protein